MILESPSTSICENKSDTRKEDFLGKVFQTYISIFFKIKYFIFFILRYNLSLSTSYKPCVEINQRYIIFPIFQYSISESDNAGSIHFKSLEISPTASNAEELMVHKKLKFNFILILFSCFHFARLFNFNQFRAKHE